MRAFDFRNPMFVASLQPIPAAANQNIQDVANGAGLVISLYKMISSYGGSAIRVRRSSDNAEQDIGFSGNGLDTSSLLSFADGSDAYIKTWYDQKGNSNNNMTISSATSQAKIADAGAYGSTMVLGSDNYPAAEFDGGDYYLSAGNPTVKMAKNGTVVVHGQRNSTLKANHYYAYQEHIPAGVIYGPGFDYPSDGYLFCSHWNNGSWISPNGALSSSDNTMISTVHSVDAGGNAAGSSSATVYGYENNVQRYTQGTDSTLLGNTVNSSRLGGQSSTYYFAGKLRTVMVFSSVMQSSDRALCNNLIVT